MKFEELWEEVEKLKILPQVAIDSVPSMLSETTKEILKTMEPYEVCSILKNSIDEIDDGSVESLNSIVLRYLTNHK